MQNLQQLSKVDKHNLRKYDDEQELIKTIKGTFMRKNVSIQIGLLGNYKDNLIHHYLKDYYYQMVKQINKKF